MAQYIIDVNEKNISETGELLLYGEMQGSGTQVFHTGLFVDTLKNEIEAAEKRGAKKAWDLAGRVVTDPTDETAMTELDIAEYFGASADYMIFWKSYEEVLEKYNAWLKVKERHGIGKIEVGDEVIAADKMYGVVIEVTMDGKYIVLYNDKTIHEHVKEDLILTRHYYSELADILHLLSEEQEDLDEYIDDTEETEEI